MTFGLNGGVPLQRIGSHTAQPVNYVDFAANGREPISDKQPSLRLLK